MAVLKPCPKCGAPSGAIVYNYLEATRIRWFSCYLCQFQGPREETYDLAVRGWNHTHRAKEDTLPSETE